MSIRPLLNTLRLTITHLSKESDHNICQYYLKNDSFLAATSAKRPPDFLTQGYWEKQIDNSLKELMEGSAVRLTIRHNEAPDKIIGIVNLTQIFRGSFQAAYLGFSISESHQGQGLMKEALTEIVRYAFENLNLHRIMANHLVENKRSEKLLRLLGFTVEGIAKNYLYINSAWRDHVLTSLTNDIFSFR